jgi:hypothetical protein
MEAARQLVRLRIPDGALAELLGPTYEDRLQKVLSWSGGYPREIVYLLRCVVMAATEGPPSDSELHRVRSDLFDGFRRLVSADAWPWLAGVAKSGSLSVANEAHRLAADRMLSVNAVLAYLNDQEWYDLHPALYDVPELKAAIARLEGGG